MSSSIAQQPRGSQDKLPNLAPEQLLNAASPSSAGTGCSPDSPDSPDVPLASTKRQLDGAELPFSKKIRLANEHQPMVVGAQCADETPVLLHPQPRPAYTSLGKLADPFQPVSHADSGRSFIIDWLESIGPDRKTHSQSDSCLYTADDSPPRQSTRSEPEMSTNRDADGFVIPHTPASSRSRSRAGSANRSAVPSDADGSTPSQSRGSLVGDPFYRELNLAANNIQIQNSRDQLPKDVADVVAQIRRGRDSPGPTVDQVRNDVGLQRLAWGMGESEVVDYFQSTVFANSEYDGGVKRSNRQPMFKNAVPHTGTSYKVSTPVPDMLYGYDSRTAFPKQQAQLINMGTAPVANTQFLMYPFFVIEFKGDGPSGIGSLWVATNQCLGGSASCVNMAERLNAQLRQCNNDQIQPINSAAFSIAMNGTEARLYVSWKQDDLDYYLSDVRSFLLQDPEHYIEFRKYVRNIVDWGKGPRLEEIRKSLDSLLEEGRKANSAAAKSRVPPSDYASSSSSSKVRRV